MTFKIEYKVIDSLSWFPSRFNDGFSFDQFSPKSLIHQLYDHFISRIVLIDLSPFTDHYRIRDTLSDITYYIFSHEELVEYTENHRKSRKKNIEIGI